MAATMNAEHGSRAREDLILLRRYERTRNPRDLDELVRRFMPLACKLARRYSRSADALDDLTQVAAMGLVKAVKGFDAGKGNAFSSYAVPTIVGELKRYLRDHTWAVRPPRALLERTLQVGNAIERFATTHGRSPTVAELSAQLGGLDDEQVLEALHARRAYTATSFQAPVGSDGGDEQTLADRMGSEDRELDDVEHRAVLDRLLSVLTPRERAIVRMRFVDDMTQVQIGDVVGVSQMQISRVLRSAVGRMQTVAQAQSQAGESDHALYAAA